MAVLAEAETEVLDELVHNGVESRVVETELALDRVEYGRLRVLAGPRDGGERDHRGRRRGGQTMDLVQES